MKLLVVLASARKGRVGEKIADWFMPFAQEGNEIDLVDLAKLDLPFAMEETIPGATKDFQYESPETKAWSDRVLAADAVIFVHPEYNHSVSAPLKNAIDHIYHEWEDKPIGLVGYGAAGGADAAEHLKWIGKFTNWNIVEPKVSIPEIWAAFDDKGNLNNSEEHEKNAKDMLKSLASAV